MGQLLSTGLRCSLKRSLSRCLVPPMYCLEQWLHFFDHSVVFTCSKVINAFKYGGRQEQNRITERTRGPTRFGKALNLIFPKLSSQNVRGFDHATILSPIFHGLRQDAWHNDSPVVSYYTKKNALQIMSLAASASETNEPKCIRSERLGYSVNQERIQGIALWGEGWGRELLSRVLRPKFY